MARGDVEFIGIGERFVTYKTHASITAADVGKAVTLVANATVGLGSSGDPVAGKLIVYEADGMASVQDGGYAEFDGVSGSLPTYNDIVVVNGSGKVITATSAQLLTGKHKGNRVVDVNSTTFKVVVCL